MNINIVSHGFGLTEAIRFHVEDRLRRLAGRYWGSVDRVRVTLGDENGPRGGVDKYCRISLDLRSGHTLRVEKISADLYAAVSRSAATLDRVVADSIRRERARKKRLGLGVMF